MKPAVKAFLLLVLSLGCLDAGYIGFSSYFFSDHFEIARRLDLIQAVLGVFMWVLLPLSAAVTSLFLSVRLLLRSRFSLELPPRK